MKTLATMIAAALAVMLQGTFAGASATTTSTSGHCIGMTITDYTSSYAFDDTNSTNWVNVTDGLVNFTTSSTGCVVITFAGPATATATNDGQYNQLHVRTLLDGSNACVPAPYNDTFASDASPSPEIASSITRVCKNVAAGAHTVQAQYRKDEHTVSAGDVIIYSHVLTVTHN
jgi:hypothetical protein